MKIDMRVVSFCHYLQGPACTQYLADMGADVVKVEPLRGAFERHWSGGKSYIGDVAAFVLATNRNKRSLAVDLKNPAGKDVVLRLVEGADVVMENYRPGVLDRLGFGYETIRKRKPDIIYASASGLGATGPAATRPGQDLLMQARSGLVAVTGGGEQGPAVVGAAIVDQHGAALLAMGILGAYVRRLQTGVGTYIESSLFGAGIDLQSEALTMYYAAPERTKALRRDRHVGSWYHDAPYGLYELADCQIVLSMNDPAKLAAALDSDALRALEQVDRYAERDRYARTVADILCSRSYAEVAPAFEAHGIWHERVQNYEELRRDPQAIHNGVFGALDVRGQAATFINHPLRYDGKVPACSRIPLEPGADSLEILSELGYDASEQRRLVECGAIGAVKETVDA
jgi:crotonobetainyl-CoA:carnitine CoA-transferase CaiB-like acyl-CoA transferase